MLKILPIPTTKELELINNNKFTFENQDGKVELVNYKEFEDEVKPFMEEFENFYK